MGIRIIAGEFGGRRLEAPPGRETRPTSDRVREALFSILGSMDELVVLDVYAGSGALGLEALSRGATRATFIDQSRLAIATLRKNIATLELGDRCEVVQDSAVRALNRSMAPVDLVFADPPYADLARAAPLLEQLAKRSALAKGARIVVEHRSTDRPELPSFELAPTRIYGDTALTLGQLRGA
jgi:16S rRNA (guanine966-N2)-methyltransferase